MRKSKIRLLAMAAFSLSGIAIALTHAEDSRLRTEATEKAGDKNETCWGTKDVSGTWCPRITYTAVPANVWTDPPTPLPPMVIPPPGAPNGGYVIVIVGAASDSRGVPNCDAGIYHLGWDYVRRRLLYGTTIGSTYRICNEGNSYKPPAKEPDPTKSKGWKAAPEEVMTDCPGPSPIYVCHMVTTLGANGTPIATAQWDLASPSEIFFATPDLRTVKCGKYPDVTSTGLRPCGGE